MTASATSDHSPPAHAPAGPAPNVLTPVTLFNGWLGRCDRCDEVVIHANGEQVAEDVARHFDCGRATALACGVRVHVVIADLEHHLRKERQDDRKTLNALRDLSEIPDAEAALQVLLRARARRGRHLRLERAIDGIRFAMRRRGLRGQRDPG